MAYNSIYVSHFLTSWSDRLYEFASYLFIIDIFKQSLLLPSIYGFTVTVCAILFSNYVGRYVDSTDRLKMVRVTMVTQKVSIVASCSMFIWMNLFEDYKIVKYSFVVLFGC